MVINYNKFSCSGILISILIHWQIVVSMEPKHLPTFSNEYSIDDNAAPKLAEVCGVSKEPRTRADALVNLCKLCYVSMEFMKNDTCIHITREGEVSIFVNDKVCTINTGNTAINDVLQEKMLQLLSNEGPDFYLLISEVMDLPYERLTEAKRKMLINGRMVLSVNKRNE